MKLYRKEDGEFVGFVGVPKGRKRLIYLWREGSPTYYKKVHLKSDRIKYLDEDVAVIETKNDIQGIYKLILKYGNKMEELREMRKNKEISLTTYLKYMRRYVRAMKLLEQTLADIQMREIKKDSRGILRFRLRGGRGSLIFF